MQGRTGHENILYARRAFPETQLGSELGRLDLLEFILLFQRREDGPVMENGWIDGPVYAVEINVDSDTCDVPKVYIAKMEFDGMKDWTAGCSPSRHSLFYNAIHEDKLTSFWGLGAWKSRSMI